MLVVINVSEIAVLIAAAIALLVIYCSVQARTHTTHPPPPTAGGPSPGARVAGYNSSASAVCAVWLFATIYFVNTYAIFLVLCLDVTC